MSRGINRQVIFEDEEDYEKMLQIVKDCKEKSGFQLFAYCFMENHIHLLIKVENDGIEKIFKRLGVRYVYWYNFKYGRVGHLFQDRYKSEPIEDDQYFLTVLGYIHQNPVKSGVCKKAEEYKWSSYREYCGEQGITDVEYALKLFHEDKEEAIKEFIQYSTKENADLCLDIEAAQSSRLSDKEAQEIIKSICRVKNASEVQKFDPEKRNQCLAAMKVRGLSIRQISRLTGISFGVVRKI